MPFQTADFWSKSPAPLSLLTWLQFPPYAFRHKLLFFFLLSWKSINQSIFDTTNSLLALFLCWWKQPIKIRFFLIYEVVLYSFGFQQITPQLRIPFPPFFLPLATAFPYYFYPLMFSESLCFADKYGPSPNEKMCNLLFTRAILFLTMTKYLLYVTFYCMANKNTTFELYICILKASN